MTVPLDKSLALARKRIGLSVANEVVSWFSYTFGLTDPNELKAQARKLIANVLKDEYGSFEDWYGKWSYLALPFLKYVNRGFPFIEFRVDLYIAATVHVRFDNYNEQQAEFVKPIKNEIVKFKVPVTFLHALAEGDLRRLSQFRVVERDRDYITLDIPGFGEARLKDSLIPCWRSFFKGKRVGEALSQAGLLPHDAGDIIDACLECPAGVPQLQSGGYEDLVNRLFSVGWSKTQAEERAKYVIEKYPDASLEEKIKYALSG